MFSPVKMESGASENMPPATMTVAAPTPVGTTSLELKTRRAQFQTQASTVATRRRQAVCVRRAFKKYGPKRNPNVILDGLNMTVPKGTM